MKYFFIDKIIQKLGRKNYKVDEKISTYNMLILISEKSIELIRGVFLKLFLKKSKGIIFDDVHTLLM
jgi:hypothetical protein